MPTTLGPLNNFPNEERDKLLQLMRGAGVEILVGPKLLFAVENQDKRTWCLSKAWLGHHSRLFKRLFEGNYNTKQILIDNEPEIFNLFVEYMIRGQFTYRDNPRVSDGIRESARAWVLGEFLEAPKFQNVAMRSLYNIYRGRSGSGVCPAAFVYVCENCDPDCALYRFFRDLIVTNWGDKAVVVESDDDNGITKINWPYVFETYPEFRDNVLSGTRVGGYDLKELGQYLVPEEEN